MHWYTDDLWKAYLGWLSPRWAEPREDFDAEKWCDQLITGGFRIAVVHAKHHDGICFYPSQFRSGQPLRDYFGEIVAAARQRGIRIVTYYSTTFDTWTWEEHPEWACREQDGSVMAITRFPFPLGVLCHNNPGYRGFLLGQLKEIQDRYDTDGFWMDGFDYTGYPTPACFCHFCRERYTREHDGETLDSVFMSDKLKYWQRDVFYELMAEIKTVSQSDRDDRIVVYNNAGTNLELGYEKIDTLCTFNSMEAHSAITKSLTSRLLSCQGKPFEIYSPVSDKVFSWTPRTTPMLTLEAAITVAHGGTVLAGLDITASGHIPDYQMKQLGKVGRYIDERSEFLRGARPLYDVGLFLPKEQWKDERGTWAITLLRHHIPFAQLPLDARDFSQYRAVVVADGFPMTEELAASLAGYVENGGNVLVERDAAGVRTEYGDSFLLEHLLGIRPCGRHGFDVSYLSGIDESIADGLWNEPIRAGGEGWRVELNGAVPIARYVFPVARYSSQRWIWREPNPPRSTVSDDAAVTLNRFGRGTAIYVACPVGIDESRQRRGIARLSANLVQALVGEALWKTDAPSGVEVVLAEQKDRYVLHLLNHYVDESSRFDKGEDVVPALSGINVWLNEKRIGPVAGAYLVPSGAQQASERDNAYMRIHTYMLEVHSMYFLNKA